VRPRHGRGGLGRHDALAAARGLSGDVERAARRDVPPGRLLPAQPRGRARTCQRAVEAVGAKGPAAARPSLRVRTSRRRDQHQRQELFQRTWQRPPRPPRLPQRQWPPPRLPQRQWLPRQPTWVTLSMSVSCLSTVLLTGAACPAGAAMNPIPAAINDANKTLRIRISSSWFTL